jgi:hypothetical protein
MTSACAPSRANLYATYTAHTGARWQTSVLADDSLEREIGHRRADARGEVLDGREEYAAAAHARLDGECGSEMTLADAGTEAVTSPSPMLPGDGRTTS